MYLLNYCITTLAQSLGKTPARVSYSASHSDPRYLHILLRLRTTVSFSIVIDISKLISSQTYMLYWMTVFHETLLIRTLAKFYDSKRHNANHFYCFIYILLLDGVIWQSVRNESAYFNYDSFSFGKQMSWGDSHFCTLYCKVYVSIIFNTHYINYVSNYTKT